MKNSSNIKNLFIMSVALFLLLGICNETRANAIQFQYLDAAINLGLARGRIMFNGVSDDANVVADLGRASLAIRNAGDEFARFFKPSERRTQARERMIRYIENYANVTQGRSESAKGGYINDAFGMLRGYVTLTYDSTRVDDLRWQSNCDELIVLMGYKFGQAWVVSTIEGHRARNFQSGFIAEWRDAKNKGILLSMDSENQNIRERGFKKVCCCFGNKALWDRLPRLDSFSPVELFEKVQFEMRTIVLNAVLPPGPCGAGRTRNEGPDLSGDWNGGNLVITREGNKYIARHYNLRQQFLNAGWRNGQVRMEIYIDTYNGKWKGQVLVLVASGRFEYKEATVDIMYFGPEGSRPYEELIAEYSGGGRVSFRRYK